MSTTLSIGGATYDLFIRVAHETVHTCEGEEAIALPLGEKIRIEDLIEAQGGGACNTSIGLSRLGCHASFSGVVGDDQWGHILLKTLKKEGVNTECMTIVEDEVSSFSLILSASSGERTILYDPGTNRYLHDVTFDRDLAESVDWIYFNHIQESTCVIQDDLINIFHAEKRPGLTWNPGGCQLKSGLNSPDNRNLLARTSALLLNKEEAQSFTQSSTIDEAVTTLLKMGAENVLITDGGNGTIASDGNKRYHCPVLSDVEVVDTTGAGDAFGTGVTWALINGQNLPTAMKAGTINAASVVTHTGAQAGLLTETDMHTRLTHTPLTVTATSL